ncbi:MAG: hypothetical protein C0476_08545 [Sphingomonas sp.]|nr:hypothetical protein [Sphingomonas sp.]
MPALGFAADIDRLAIGISGLCAVHCLASTVLIALAASAGGLVLHPAIHEFGLVIAIMLGVIALGGGIMRHGAMVPAAVGALGLGMMAGATQLPHGAHYDGSAETFWTLIGVGLLAAGHALNQRVSR